jgi:gamma-glutamyltranspeptidase/glutathione hydrolase
MENLNFERTIVTRKQPVTASQAVVSANHPMAAAAGLQMLSSGGSVADAAVAAAFAASVVEPMMMGIFGAGYILIRNGETGAVRVIDNYSPAPSAARPEMYVSNARQRERENRIGYLACAVPGSLKAWCSLHAELGKLPLAVVLAPAITYAEHGFPVSPYLFQCIEAEKNHLALFPESAKLFLPDRQPPPVGSRLVNPDYAATLREIAAQGPDIFYRGPLGARVLADVRAHGGILSSTDLENYTLIDRAPVRGTYRGYEVNGVPLTSAGGIMIQEALNILEEFDLRSLGFASAQYWHLILEVLKIVFADRNRYLGDPDFVAAPTARLTDKNYAAARCRQIDPRRAAQYPAGLLNDADDSHTTHISVLDVSGNLILMTQTLMDFFGCRALIAGTGAFMNNTMALFDPRPGLHNSVAPGTGMGR